MIDPILVPGRTKRYVGSLKEREHLFGGHMDLSLFGDPKNYDVPHESLEAIESTYKNLRC
jgi:hypothetical protein